MEPSQILVYLSLQLQVMIYAIWFLKSFSYIFYRPLFILFFPLFTFSIISVHTFLRHLLVRNEFSLSAVLVLFFFSLPHVNLKSC